jgi:hypothetical protein
MTPTGNVIPPSVPRPWARRRRARRNAHGLSNPGHFTTPDFDDYGGRLRRPDRVRELPTAVFAMSFAVRTRRQSTPIRLSVARELGRDIDGAWWPRADRITNELPELVAVLTPLLGNVTSINANWSSLQRPPDFNWPGWEGKRQHVMTVTGTHACANLLIVSYATHSALALMVLRCAADLPIEGADRVKPAFIRADSILRAAQQQRGHSSGY